MSALQLDLFIPLICVHPVHPRFVFLFNHNPGEINFAVQLERAD